MWRWKGGNYIKTIRVVVIIAILIITSSFIATAAPQFSSGRGKGVFQLVDSENNPIGEIYFNFRVSDKIHPKHGPLYGYIIFEIDLGPDGVIDEIISLTDIYTINFGYGIIAGLYDGSQCIITGTTSVTNVATEQLVTENIIVRLHDTNNPSDVDYIDFELDSETYNFGEIINGNIFIKIPGSNGRR